MSIEDINYLIDHIVNLREIHRFSLKTVLKKLDTIITIYHARNSFPPDAQIQIDGRIVKLTEEIDTLQNRNQKIEIRLYRLEKTIKILTKQKTIK